jgi:2-oxoglutarate dehydrogenase complex dehydrogenase (E1) component-like enzyme
MGAWPNVSGRLHVLSGGAKVGHASRPESASPATGSFKVHLRQQEDLLDRAFEGV